MLPLMHRPTSPMLAKLKMNNIYFHFVMLLLIQLMYIVNKVISFIKNEPEH